jgi:hypothetical protein
MNVIEITNQALSLLGAQPVSVSRLTTGLTNTAPNGGTANNISDGSVSTDVTTTVNISTTNNYVVAHIDMGLLKWLAYVDVLNLRLTAGSSTQFQLQYSADNALWSQGAEAFSITTTSDNRWRCNLALETRYLRLVRVGTTDLGTAKVSVAGIDIYPWGTAKKDGHCARLYPPVRENVLAHHAWQCTQRKAILTATTAPVSEWPYAWAMPDYRLHGGALALFSSATATMPYKNWTLQQDRVLTDLSTAPYLDYQIRSEEWQMPPHVRTLFRYALAAELAESITDMSSKRDYWHVKAWGSPQEGKAGYSREARNFESRMQPSPQIQDFSLTEVR